MLWIIKLDIMADLYIGGTSAGFLVILFEYALLDPISSSFIGWTDELIAAMKRFY